jgi:hypothetical protein
VTERGSGKGTEEGRKWDRGPGRGRTEGEQDVGQSGLDGWGREWDIGLGNRVQ